MAEERKIGSLELLECLSEDPFGTVYRGQEWTAPRKTREVLVRRYHAAWLDLGLDARRHEILRNLVHMGHLKPFKGCHMSQDGSPQLLWPLASGRSLAQALRAAETQGIPFGIDQALFLVWALSHHIRHLNQVELSPGILTPHRVWIGFDGWIQLLDVPTIKILQELLPAMPMVRDTMQSYLQGPASGGLAFEAHQLGALLFELLTHNPLPARPRLEAALADTRMALLDGTQEPVPETILRLLSRLLGLSDPFQTLEELERTIEESVFGGDFDPSTFGLAFMMQTLFRREITASATTVRESTPEPLVRVEAADARPARPWLPRSRRLAVISAATVLGGMFLWLGARAYSNTEAVPAPPAKPPVPVTSPAPIPLPEAATQTLTPVGSASPAVPIAGNPQHLKAAPVAATQSPSLTAPSPAQPVRLRVFLDEEGRVHQANVLSGATPGSEREQAAYAIAMQKKQQPTQSGGQAVRGWQEVTVLVP